MRKIFNIFKKTEPVVIEKEIVKTEYVPLIFNKIDVKPGDVITLVTQNIIHESAIDHIRDSLKCIWPNNKIIIMEEGMIIHIAEEIK